MNATGILCTPDSASFTHIKSRKATKGPELDMVRAFLGNSPVCSSMSARGNYAMFLEPEIDSGFPDLVLVQFNSASLEKRLPLRNTLGTTDLKILADICTHRPSKDTTICSRTGFSPADTNVSLELLASCNLIEMRGCTWKAAKLADFFAIKSIISIEAKIGNVSAAAHQALLNKRFSSESYILLDSASISKNTFDICRRYEIGAIINGGKTVKIPAPCAKVPINHVSLQFNEWIGSKLAEGRPHEAGRI